jgi:hypothetical protein
VVMYTVCVCVVADCADDVVSENGTTDDAKMTAVVPGCVDVVVIVCVRYCTCVLVRRATRVVTVEVETSA